MDHPLAPTCIGSKFIPIYQLERILGNHPNWKRIQATICDGTEYHTMPIEDKIRITDLRHRLLKSKNNSSSVERTKTISTKLAKESEKGWCIPILPNHSIEIPNLQISLLEITPQASINERGEIIEKDRVTHDPSFPGIRSETSINERVYMGGNLQKPIMGTCKNDCSTES